jgi:hypothetical protein
MSMVREATAGHLHGTAMVAEIAPASGTEPLGAPQFNANFEPNWKALILQN